MTRRRRKHSARYNNIHEAAAAETTSGQTMQQNKSGSKLPKNEKNIGNNIEEIVENERVPAAAILSTSTLRRKRNLLAKLESSLSPKYIGFIETPPTLYKMEQYSVSGSEERTRSSRRRKLYNSTEVSSVHSNNSFSGNESFPGNVAVTDCIRITRGNVSNEANTTPNKILNVFISPIEKLLRKNGATSSPTAAFDETPKKMIFGNVKKEKRSKSKSSLAKPPEQPLEETKVYPKTEVFDIETMIPSCVVENMKGITPNDQNSKKSDCEDVASIQVHENKFKKPRENFCVPVTEIENLDYKKNLDEVLTEDRVSMKDHNEVMAEGKNRFKKEDDEENCIENNTEQEELSKISTGNKTVININEDHLLTNNETKIAVINTESEPLNTAQESKLVIRQNEPHNDNIHQQQCTEDNKTEIPMIIIESNEQIIPTEQSHTHHTELLVIDIDNAAQSEVRISTTPTPNITTDDDVVITAQSPSAASVDSAKGSSVVTGIAWISYETGDLFWGQIYAYCYWPCMVCPDPEGKTITTEKNIRNGEESVMVHVRFFADNRRRNWVKRENLIPYVGLDNYILYAREARTKYGNKSSKYKQLLPKNNKLTIWKQATKEADMVAGVLYSERLKKFEEISGDPKATHKKDRKRSARMFGSSRIDRQTSNSDASSMYNFSVTDKRDRSVSPLSPEFSPLKAAMALKRRRLSSAEAKAEVGLDFPATLSGTIETNNSKVSLESYSTSSSVGSVSSLLQDNEIFNNNEFKKFYLAMKDYVMEQNHDDHLEKGLVMAVQNIWALKHLNRTQVQQRLVDNFNKHELGSSLVDSGRGESKFKRLSNRLRNISIRSSIVMTQSKPSFDDETRQTREEKQPRKTINRPIEEVIDDIFNLDNKYLFKGLGRDPVCKYCFQPGGKLERCSKGCNSWLHIYCIEKTHISSNGTKRGKRSKTDLNVALLVDSTKATIHHATADGVPNDVPIQREKGNENEDSPTSNLSLSESDIVATPSLVVCQECALNKELTCTVCDQSESSQLSSSTPSTSSSSSTLEKLVVCNMQQCAKAFHPSCCKYWPQAKITKSKNVIESFRCPSHVCQTCVSDDPKGKFQHLSSAKLTKCVKCPASYHTDSTCIPSGSQILTASHIICPRHSVAKSDNHVNVSWCFICAHSGGGAQVVCCETCPTAVHAQCLNIPIDVNEGYICEECESGRMPLYGEMVWAKFTSFRWWPAIILPPPEIPENIRRKNHNPSDFVVRFFGTHDHGWISRRRVYLYVEGDSSAPPRAKSYLDHSYMRGVEEAKKIYEIVKLKKQKQKLSNENKEKLHPQPYVRIKANRAVYPVKLHIDMEKVNKCECDPDSTKPCGPDSNCLNRVLYHECNPKICPGGDRCQNQMFESKISPRLDVIYMKERGFGLVCREPISAGTFIIEYVGEVINDDEFRQRIAQKTTDRDENFYFLSLEKDYIIDAGPKGNLARFMNHSCDPNCETQKWSVNGLNRVGLFAIKDIPVNTELTFNYHWDELLGTEKKTCFCGATKCAGQIGEKYKEEKVLVKHEVTTKVKGRSAISRKMKPLKRLKKQPPKSNKKNVAITFHSTSPVKKNLKKLPETETSNDISNTDDVQGNET